MQLQKLTDAQIANWRKVLFEQIGAYAFIMPSENIQAHADQMQKRLNQLSQNKK